MTDFNWTSWAAIALVLLGLLAFFSLASNAESLVPTIQPVPAGAIADDITGRIEPYQPAFR
jgi:hypothetical protein